ncbi:hypothetical protein BDZ90DRAFT_273340 [Jaminaea rosea]|uniref:Uncharacterized protein n=1 Tax=Jaminaea rosea TaxID=1569628 RepID=A0A316UVJ8_9BASI|nr:hypothetical protein BDZ90DRAFT_273340 [Jaminaea rosea]PWN29262.1 hypothetical protein BDZ90DRAFT_273340 [Jaminaea rosea]
MPPFAIIIPAGGFDHAIVYKDDLPAPPPSGHLIGLEIRRWLASLTPPGFDQDPKKLYHLPANEIGPLSLLLHGQESDEVDIFLAAPITPPPLPGEIEFGLAKVWRFPRGTQPPRNLVIPPAPSPPAATSFSFRVPPTTPTPPSTSSSTTRIYGGSGLLSTRHARAEKKKRKRQVEREPPKREGLRGGATRPSYYDGLSSDDEAEDQEEAGEEGEHKVKDEDKGDEDSKDDRDNAQDNTHDDQAASLAQLGRKIKAEPDTDEEDELMSSPRAPPPSSHVQSTSDKGKQRAIEHKSNSSDENVPSAPAINPPRTLRTPRKPSRREPDPSSSDELMSSPGAPPASQKGKQRAIEHNSSSSNEDIPSAPAIKPPRPPRKAARPPPGPSSSDDEFTSRPSILSSLPKGSTSRHARFASPSSLQPEIPRVAATSSSSASRSSSASSPSLRAPPTSDFYIEIPPSYPCSHSRIPGHCGLSCNDDDVAPSSQTEQSTPPTSPTPPTPPAPPALTPAWPPKDAAPLVGSDDDDEEAVRAAAEILAQRIARTMPPPPPSQRQTRTGQRQGEDQRRWEDETILSRLVPAARAARTGQAIREARADVTQPNFFHRGDVRSLEATGVEEMRRRGDPTFSAGNNLVWHELRCASVVAKRKVRVRYHEGCISGIEMVRYACGMTDEEQATGMMARLASKAVLYCRTWEEYQALLAAFPHLDARHHTGTGTYLIVVRWRDRKGRLQMSVYVGATWDQAMADRHRDHVARFRELRWAEENLRPSEVSRFQYGQSNLYRRNTVETLHFVLTQTPQNLELDNVGHWYELLAHELTGANVAALGETPLGPCQSRRMVTSMDEQILCVLFFAMASAAGFPGSADVEGALWPGRAAHTGCNSVVPFCQFADLRTSPSPDGSRIDFIPPCVPSRLNATQRAANAVQMINWIEDPPVPLSPSRADALRDALRAQDTAPQLAEPLHAFGIGLRLGEARLPVARTSEGRAAFYLPGDDHDHALLGHLTNAPAASSSRRSRQLVVLPVEADANVEQDVVLSASSRDLAAANGVRFALRPREGEGADRPVTRWQRIKPETMGIEVWKVVFLLNVMLRAWGAA